MPTTGSSGRTANTSASAGSPGHRWTSGEGSKRRAGRVSEHAEPSAAREAASRRAGLAVAIGGLAWMWQGGIERAKEGTLALAGAMFIGALARTVLPEARAGMLASRRRLVDVVSLAALGIGLLVVGLVLPTPS